MTIPSHPFWPRQGKWPSQWDRAGWAGEGSGGGAVPGQEEEEEQGRQAEKAGASKRQEGRKQAPLLRPPGVAPSHMHMPLNRLTHACLACLGLPSSASSL